MSNGKTVHSNFWMQMFAHHEGGFGTDGLVAEGGAIVTHCDNTNMFDHVITLTAERRTLSISCLKKTPYLGDELWPGRLMFEQQMVPPLKRNKARAGDEAREPPA